ncbi:hypothetical protein R7127_13490 [Vibrio sp. 1159]|uniref:hypothetical protein n=1 Tax=Vibrio sp. 1159 TaxID=3074545 RepID=UPI001B813FD7|nr:hypothetical protein [Vibrio sp. 1159]EJE4180201.1 hypothetical protein [Vibrio parahaemolyticus]MDG3415519.1 hypothetical protein [Vibrio parahaemolyticus]MDW2321290.1 hypothetical protein [Vibrio sp. 1159]HBC3541871.1 hypothetical protein [Vibrio parahaemolyticus]HBC3546884.1 hypothetical protein [Vibrio parahaemolyticus]
MNKSIIIGSLVIGVSVIASPFIYDQVKQSQMRKQQQELSKQREIADVVGLENFAEEYKKIKGQCPKRASDMVGVVIRKEPKDRYGIEFDTTGDCKFTSLEGITSESL